MHDPSRVHYAQRDHISELRRSVAGLVIGIVAALLGVAGGELLIPTLLFGADIKLAGSLSLR